MGYRSDVAIAFKEELAKRFLNDCTTKVALETLRSCDKHHKDGWIMFQYSDVKWYDDYEEVKAITEFMDNLRGTEDTDSFEFHRMGEDSEDYEYRNQGCSPFNICLSRSLDFDY